LRVVPKGEKKKKNDSRKKGEKKKEEGGTERHLAWNEGKRFYGILLASGWSWAAAQRWGTPKKEVRRALKEEKRGEREIGEFGAGQPGHQSNHCAQPSERVRLRYLSFEGWERLARERKKKGGKEEKKGKKEGAGARSRDVID